jgi:DNA-binding PadR family transcriptional regulator
LQRKGVIEMARGRKAGALIKNITGKDFELMKGIARTGVTSYYDARNKIGLSEKRLKNLEKENYITSKNVVVNKGKDVIKTYYLNDKGKSYIKTKTDIKNFYRSNERQIEHDLKLSSIYYSLDEEEKATWKNENDLISDYKTNNPNNTLSTMIDATYQTNGLTVGVEVTTKNYTREQIEEKYKIADEIGCKEVLKIEA